MKHTPPSLFLGLLLLSSIALALSGCPKGGSTSSSGSSQPADTWVVFEVVQEGSGNSLEATIWPDGSPENFETIIAGDAGAEAKFFGLGRTEEGYAVPFQAGGRLNLRLWTPGHEMESVSLRLKKGENFLTTELKKADTEDADVPERIRTEVLNSLPSQGPKSGS
jgi:hypothetical protein